jgi:hypothetical protein
MSTAFQSITLSLFFSGGKDAMYLLVIAFIIMTFATAK